MVRGFRSYIDPPEYAMAQPAGHPLLIIERLLRDRTSVWDQVVSERDLKGLTLQLLYSSALSLFLYGAVMGASHSAAQALSSAIKLPLLFLATLAICLPTLYLFNLLFGARLSVMQAVALIMVSITVTAVLTLAFAPISLFFLISAHSYYFIKLLNVAILFLTAIVGLRFLTSGMAYLNDHQELTLVEEEILEVRVEQPALVGAAEPNGATSTSSLPAAPPVPVATRAAQPAVAGRPTSMTLLYIWIALFGFVGTQLAWTLRPFFGDPGRGFSVFRHISGTFYADILHTIGRLLGG
jgi:hypothetical protein